MRIQVFSEYSKMVEAGRAKALLCPMHEDQIFSLQHESGNNDIIILKCYACRYSLIVGDDG